MPEPRHVAPTEPDSYPGNGTHTKRHEHGEVPQAGARYGSDDQPSGAVYRAGVGAPLPSDSGAPSLSALDGAGALCDAPTRARLQATGAAFDWAAAGR